ncbi:MAG TPA: hypothetical protein PLU11_13405 [Chitinophagaceae bacterium]|nr:hypothetical protein [Chitinophagaceae bacterium]HPH31684.1 hypothetical protein [Chitinophagaceae bacterium]HPN60176.1 hypothetical protein [Chitinophagaceae bacterium]
MKKLLNSLLLLSSFFGYLEWPPDNHGFIFQLEAEILQIAKTNASSVAHPFILLPFIGQVLLLVSLFQTPPKRWLTLTGLLCTGLLMLLLFLIGLLTAHVGIVASTLPYLLISFFVVRINFQKKGRLS